MKGSQMLHQWHLTANKNLLPKGIMGRMQPYHSFLLLDHTISGINYQAVYTWTPQKIYKTEAGYKRQAHAPPQNWAPWHSMNKWMWLLLQRKPKENSWHYCKARYPITLSLAFTVGWNHGGGKKQQFLTICIHLQDKLLFFKNNTSICTIITR